ncbi:hypothetical protein [uncultured Dysosmobacter sp.]|uniref:hypothetical protein n=1 Tax=uncultured Dysosmobacter sp. TaxID=2591384 RepID=UPI00260B42B2|nr:hypothetical protein [uncultured Dysosmobacter sp.]
MKPIYEPKGKAKEYGDYAINTYMGCPHQCYYCFAPNVLHREREAFHNCMEPRKDIVRELRRQLKRENITGKLIHLCFTCDPYPTGYDTTATREVIQALKEHGNHVQILTKGDGSRDFDLLDAEDWYGVSISCDLSIAHKAEPFAETPANRLLELEAAKCRGINTWVSFEPVLDPVAVLECIRNCAYFIDKVKIGKLNYWPSDIDWAKFGREAEALCKSLDMDYYIKDSLRKEMEEQKGGEADAG